MIVYEIERYLAEKDDEGYKLGISETKLDKLLTAAGTVIGDAFKYNLLPPEKHDRSGKLYPSSATKCELQNLYKYLGIPTEPLDPRVKLGFFYGRLIETGLVFCCVAANVDIRDVNTLMEMKIGGLDCRGRSDGIVAVDGVRRNVEFKSMAGYSFKRFQSEGLDDSWGYLGQINVYMRHQLEHDLIDPPGETIYVAANKDTLHLAERVISYNPDYAHRADENFARIARCAEKKKQMKRPIYVNDKGEVFRGKTDGRGNLPIGCAYCGAKWTCWTEPKQVVSFNPETGDPVFKKRPTTTLKVEMKSDRWGSMRPKFRVVDM